MRTKKKRIRKWAARHNGKFDFFHYDCDRGTQSYFATFDNECNCVEYGFDNVTQLRKCLSKLWENEPVMLEVILPVTVAIYKGRPQSPECTFASEQAIESGTDISIPEFVYVF